MNNNVFIASLWRSDVYVVAYLKCKALWNYRDLQLRVSRNALQLNRIKVCKKTDEEEYAYRFITIWLFFVMSSPLLRGLINI